MSAIKDIPWNMKPKNGVRSFMTEETFQQWIGLESHQTRMNERLKRFGISLSSEVPSGPWFPSVTKSDDRNKAGTSKESIPISAENIDMTSDRKTELVSAITDVCMSNTNVTPRSRTDKKDNLANLVKIKKTKSKVKHEIHESRIDQNESLNSSKIKYDSNLSISNQNPSNPPCSRMDMIGLEESTGEKHGNKKPDSLVQDDHGMKHTEFQDHHGKEHTDKAEMDQNEVLELIPPISFYRDSSEVAGEDKQTEGVMDVENTGTNIDMVHVTSHIDLHGDRKDGHVQDSAGCQVALDRTTDLTRDKPKHISAVNAQGDSIAEVDRKARQGQAFIELADPNNPTESEKRAMKQIMIADKMFYNIKDSWEYYGKRSRSVSESDMSLRHQLTDLEKHMLDTHELVETRGKNGTRVPVIIPQEAVAAMADLANPVIRKNSGIKENNPYLFANSGLDVLRAASSLEETRRECGLKFPDRVHATNLRKHCATIAQVIGLKDHEMKWLCRHLGHTRKVHEQHYRATSGLIERLDIAKLMLLQEGNLQGKFHGKALKEINFEGSRRRWTKDEEDELRRYFPAYFNKTTTRSCPSQGECNEAIASSRMNGGSLHKRGWETIKKKMNNWMKKNS